MAGEPVPGKSYSQVELEVLSPDSCEGCGLCCEGIGSPVLLYKSLDDPTRAHPHRPDGLPEELIREIDEAFGGLFRGHEPRAKCLWFDAERRQCKHHEWRPQVCRDYEVGGQACLAEREAWMRHRDPNWMFEDDAADAEPGD